MRRSMEEREAKVIYEGSHLAKSDRRLRPAASLGLPVNSPVLGSKTPEDPVVAVVVSVTGFEVLVSVGGGGVVVELSVGVEAVVSVLVSVGGGGVVVELSVGVELVVSVVVESMVVLVDVELSGGVKPLVSVVFDDDDKSGGLVAVEFDKFVKSVQLYIEVMLAKLVLLRI